jgi:hypothetical protein
MSFSEDEMYVDIFYETYQTKFDTKNIRKPDTKNTVVSAKQERRFYNRARLCYQFDEGSQFLQWSLGFNYLFLFFKK